jgi:glucose/mannose-6-phosphate isomerase
VADSLGLLASVPDLPGQIELAASAVCAADLDPASGVTAVVVIAEGAAARAARAVAAITTALPVPMLVADEGRCPSFVGPHTLVIALSAPGDGLGVSSAAAGAAEAGARTIVVAPDGELAEVVPGNDVERVRLPISALVPRAVIIPMAVAVLSVLGRTGLLEDPAPQIADAAAQARLRVGEWGAPTEPAVALARRIGRTLPITYGAGALGGSAAGCWKARFNLDPKVPAFSNHVPALLHDEVSGWAQHGDVTRQVFSLVVLRHDHESSRDAAQLDQVSEAYQELTAGVHVVRAAGRGPLAQWSDLVISGDMVGLRMAEAEGVDPGPGVELDELVPTPQASRARSSRRSL